MRFYVYEWFVVKTDEIFYVGKGCRNRYKAKNKRRGKIFNDYLSKNECSSRIVRWFDDEQSAYDFEGKRIAELKAIGQAQANRNNGSGGSYQTHVTDEMRSSQSLHNIMKRQEQRERMIRNNPMKNKDVSNKVASQTRRAVILDGVRYAGVLEASRITGRGSTSIIKWCKRGYDDNGKPCHYEGEKQKPIPLVRITHPKSATPKAVLVDGVRYETVLDGAKAIGGNSSNLIKAIKGNRKYLGHKVEYAISPM